ncbi:MAG TPA: hypothetical protein VK137_06620, partial [Planctomycetaceae bacterium]|nr:hypothetical protein [Planctomycetaceae bacterium]
GVLAPDNGPSKNNSQRPAYGDLAPTDRSGKSRSKATGNPLSSGMADSQTSDASRHVKNDDDSSADDTDIPVLSTNDDGPSIPPTKLFESPDDVLNSPDTRPLSTQLVRVERPSTSASEKPSTNDGSVANNTASKNTVAGGTARTASTGANDDSPRDTSVTSVNGDKPSTAAEEASGVFVLAADGASPKRFPTLEAACAAVADGSAIELRYNGRRAEKPLRLSKKNLTIRAAKGFRPIIEFSPANLASDAHLRLVSVSSGPVQINNVAFEITVPPFFAVDRISLFSVDRSEQLRLQGVAITLNNPGQRPTALFDLSIEPGQMLADMKMSSTGMPRDPLEIELTECFVRGHGDLFHVRHTKPCRLLLRDTAVALSGTLLRVEGYSEKPAEQTRLELRMEHVTGLLGQNLVRLDTGDPPRELPFVAVNARNNVLTTTGNSALVAVSGSTSDADFRKLFSWTGEKNFYDRCQIFWSFASGAEPLDFDDWKGTWGANGDVGASNEKLAWLAERSDMSQSTPQTFTLDRRGESPNPAVGAATDGNDAGADAAKLPRPAEAEPRSE